jgi:hypothetical protein
MYRKFWNPEEAMFWELFDSEVFIAIGGGDLRPPNDGGLSPTPTI